MRKLTLGLVVPAAMAAGLCLGALPALAANGVMQECSAQYKADKAAGKLKSGETWTKYYSACAKAKKKDETPPEPGAKAAKAASKTKAAKSDKPLTPAQKAAHKRIKECGAMWQKDKAAGKIKKGQTWPKYWHACSDKLKKQSK